LCWAQVMRRRLDARGERYGTRCYLPHQLRHTSNTQQQHNTLQHTATIANILQTYCKPTANLLQTYCHYTARHCNILLTRCNTRKHSKTTNINVDAPSVLTSSLTSSSSVLVSASGSLGGTKGFVPSKTALFETDHLRNVMRRFC